MKIDKILWVLGAALPSSRRRELAGCKAVQPHGLRRRRPKEIPSLHHSGKASKVQGRWKDFKRRELL